MAVLVFAAAGLVAMLLLNLVQWLAERNEAAKLNTPATYAKCAKLQRLANAKEKELAVAGTAGSAAKTLKWANSAKAVCSVAVAVAMWKSPVGHVPISLTSPFTRTLQAPHWAAFQGTGLIAAAPWLMMCNRASSILVRALLPMRPPSPPATAPTRREKVD